MNLRRSVRAIVVDEDRRAPRSMPALLASLWQSGPPVEPVRLSGH